MSWTEELQELSHLKIPYIPHGDKREIVIGLFRKWNSAPTPSHWFSNVSCLTRISRQDNRTLHQSSFSPSPSLFTPRVSMAVLNSTKKRLHSPPRRLISLLCLWRPKHSLDSSQLSFPIFISLLRNLHRVLQMLPRLPRIEWKNFPCVEPTPPKSRMLPSFLWTPSLAV